MRKLLIISIFALLLTSCKEEPSYEPFIGQWVPDQNYPDEPNVFYFGLFTDSVRSTRRISYTDTVLIVIWDAPSVTTGAHVENGVLKYNSFWAKNHPITPNCSQDSIVFYDVSSEIHGEVMTETGSYAVYVNGFEQDRFYNYYIAKFVKRK